MFVAFLTSLTHKKPFIIVTMKLSSEEINLCFQLPVVKELGDEAFSYVFEGSELLAKLTEGLDPVECKTIFAAASCPKKDFYRLLYCILKIARLFFCVLKKKSAKKRA
jgi:hypothetical protein